jgi:cellobiose-specific phosphotransferase system component IIA
MEELDTVSRDDLAATSMNVILHAGNARAMIFEAADKAADGAFDEAEDLMKQANAELVEAHHAQTATIQKEAEGVIIPYSSLFGHAQDHLMTVTAERHLVKEIIKLYRKIN